MVAGVWWEGVWLLLVLGFLSCSSSPANKMAAGPGSILLLPLGSLPCLLRNEVDGSREGGGGSYAGTSMPSPWRGLASAALAPSTLIPSCCNNTDLGVCVSPYSPLFLAMVVGKVSKGATQFPDLVEWCFDLCSLSAGRRFFPSLHFPCHAAMEVARSGLHRGWQLKMGSTPARSGALLLDALELIPQRVVAWPSSIFVIHPLQGEQLGNEIDADNVNEMLSAKSEALEENSLNMLISIGWYAKLSFHHAFILEITLYSLQPFNFAADHSWNCKKWNNLLSVNMERQVNIATEALLNYFVHTESFQRSKRFGCASMLTGSSFNGTATVSKEQVSPICFCCTRSTLMVGSTVEDIVPLLFGLCHWRWATVPSLLILGFNRGDSSSLSSVKAIQHLQLNTHKPQVHTPDRPLGESPAGHQLVWSTKEALGDCSCSKFEPDLSTDDRQLFDSNCILRSWGIISLTVAYFWQLYTLWILVKLHEAVPGRRYNRYVELAQAAFGEKLGVWLALFPTIYLSAGTATALILVGGETMKLFYQIVCGPLCLPSPISTVEWYLVFTSLSVILSQLPNLNSIAGVSLIGGATAIMYCTMSWVLSVSQQRPTTVSYEPVKYTSFGSSLFSTMNALGIIAFAFRGHNLALEIQATMPSTFKHPAHVPMWRGAKAAYLLIAMCIFPVAIGGYWAYGNMIPPGGILTALYVFHSHDISRGLLAVTFLLVVFNCLSSFQIYSMPVFDSFEAYYTGRTNRPCSVWVRSGFRVFYGFISLFIGIALPFLSSLAGLLGGLTLPVTFAYPCFMWICIKKPERFSFSWYLNWGLALLGTAFSVASSVGGVWSIVNTGMKLKFFKLN